MPFVTPPAKTKVKTGDAVLAELAQSIRLRCTLTLTQAIATRQQLNDAFVSTDIDRLFGASASDAKEFLTALDAFIEAVTGEPVVKTETTSVAAISEK